MVEDQAVPAHALEILHGKYDNEGNPTLINNDNFEYYAGWHKINYPFPVGGKPLDTNPDIYMSDLQQHICQELEDGITAPPPSGLLWIPHYWQYKVYGIRDNEIDDYFPTLIGNLQETHLVKSSVTDAIYWSAGAARRASQLLPPLVVELPENLGDYYGGEAISFGFKILENRTPKVYYSIRLLNAYGQDIGISIKEETGIVLDLEEDNSKSPLPYAKWVEMEFSGKDSSGDEIPPGKYILEIAVRDEDGNWTPQEVNFDDVTSNNTRASLNICNTAKWSNIEIEAADKVYQAYVDESGEIGITSYEPLECGKKAEVRVEFEHPVISVSVETSAQKVALASTSGTFWTGELLIHEESPVWPFMPLTIKGTYYCGSTRMFDEGVENFPLVSCGIPGCEAPPATDLLWADLNGDCTPDNIGPGGLISDGKADSLTMLQTGSKYMSYLVAPLGYTLKFLGIEGVFGVTVKLSKDPSDPTGQRYILRILKIPCDAKGSGFAKIAVLMDGKQVGLVEFPIVVPPICTTIDAQALFDLEGKSVATNDWIAGDTYYFLKGQAPKEGGTVKIVNVTQDQSGKNIYVTNFIPVAGEIKDESCVGPFKQKISIKKGRNYIFGLDNSSFKDICTAPLIVNADPSFVFPGVDKGESPARVPREYLSPWSSPGMQDEGVFTGLFDERAQVTARVLTPGGQVVRTLMRDSVIDSSDSISWDGENDSGNYVPDGQYQLLLDARLLETGIEGQFAGIYVVDNEMPEARLVRIEGAPQAGKELAIVGTVLDENFKSYSLKAVGSDGIVREIAEGQSQHFEGVLGILPADLPVGTVQIKLRVEDMAWNFTEAEMTVDLRGPPSELRVVIDDVSTSIISSAGSFVPDGADIYIDDQGNLPKGATILGTGGSGLQGFKFVDAPVYSGLQSHTSGPGAGHRVHYMIHADDPLMTDSINNDLIIQYVYITPGVEQLIVQFYTGNGDGEHRAVFGAANAIQTGGVMGTDSQRHISTFLQNMAGRWVRLRIPASLVGVLGKPIKGIAFHVYGSSEGAQAFWDKTTTASSGKDMLPTVHFVEPGQIDDYTQASITFTTSKDDLLTLQVVDDENNTVKTLIKGDQMLGAGRHTATWQGTNEAGNQVVDGRYHLQFGTPDGHAIDCDRLEPVQEGGIEFDLQSTPINLTPSLVDGEGNSWEINTALPGDARIVKRSSSGTILGELGKGSLPNPFADFEPKSLVADANANVYIVDGGGSRLIKLSPELTYLGETLLPMGSPEAAVLDQEYGNQGHIFVRNNENEVLQVNVGRVPVDQKNIVADIVLPANESLVRGKVPIIGTASARNFKEYSIAWSLSVNGKPCGELVRSSSERIMTMADLMPPPNMTLSGNLGTFDVGRDEYPYIPADRTVGAPSAEYPGLNGVYTLKLKVDTLDGKTAGDSVTLVVGRLLGQAFGGKSFSQDGRIEVRVPSMSLESSFEIVAFFPAKDIGRNTSLFPAPGLTQLGEIYEARPAGLKFNNASTLSMKYGPADLDLDGDGVQDIQPESLGVYAWDATGRNWVRLETALDPLAMRLSARVSGINRYIALYGLFADLTPPTPPVIFAPYSPTALPNVTVRVRTEPGLEVELYSKSKTGEFVLAGKARSDASGYAVLPGICLFIGENELRARAVDSAGNAGEFSESVVVVRAPPVVPATQLTLHSSDYTEAIGECCVDAGSTLGIRAIGIGNPAIVDALVVNARSSESDVKGLEMALIETGVDTGVYEGALNIGTASSPGKQLLKACKEGEVVLVEAVGTPSVQASVRVDDNTIPLGPAISSTSHPSHMQLTFEDGNAGQLGPISSGVTVMVETKGEGLGGYCAKILNGQGYGSFSVKLVDKPYSLADYPILAFDYMIPAPAEGQKPVQLGLWVEANGRWYHYTFTEKRNILTLSWTTLYAQTAGYIPDVVSDGTWRHAEIPLKDSIGPATVTRIFMGNYEMTGYMLLVPANENPPGTFFYLDNLLVTQAATSGLEPSFAWQAPEDASGIAGYSVALTADPDTEPAPGTVNCTEDHISYKAADVLALNSGRLYFHARAIDGAGNAGRTNHYRIGVDTIGPVASNPSPAAGSVASPAEISMIVKDNAGGSGLEVEAIRLKINDDYSFAPAGGGFSYDSNSGKLTFRLGQVEGNSLVIRNGEPVNVELAEAPDKAGNLLQAPLEWTFAASFGQFSTGQALLLTVGGGKQPSWSPGSDRVVFSRPDENGSWKLFTIDPADIQEVNGTVKQVTFDPTGKIASDGHPAWSPLANSGLVAFEREMDGQTDIYLADFKIIGMTPIRLTDTYEPEHHPTWSPDGLWVVFERGGQLWRVPVDPGDPSASKDGPAELVYADPQCLAREPYWRNGPKILYRNALYVDNVYKLDSVSGDGGALTSENAETQPAVSPDGQQAIFVSRRTGAGAELWTMGIGGDEPRKILDNPGAFADTEPEFAPDGSAIAFESTRSGVSNIWILNTLKISPIRANHKAFSPGNADGEFDKVTLSYTVTAQALVTIRLTGPGVDQLLVKDKAVAAGVDTLVWDGKINGVLGTSGTYTFAVKAVSPYGDTVLEQSAQVRLDDLPPVTTLPAAGTFVNASGIFNVKAWDHVPYQGSGVKQLLVREGSNPFVIETYTAGSDGLYPILVDEPFSLPALGSGAEGPHSIQARAIDGIGNAEQGVKVTSIIVDTKSPRITVTPYGLVHEPEPGVRYARSSVQYTVRALDDQATVPGADSGIFRLRINGIENKGSTATVRFDYEGQRSFSADAWDNVWNSCAITYAVTVDDTSPWVGVSVSPEPVDNGTNLYVSLGDPPAMLSVKAIDGAAGVARIETKTWRNGQRVDGGTGDAFVSVPGDSHVIQLGTAGLWEIEYRAVDNVGNVCTASKYSVIVTSEPLPGVTLGVTGPEYRDAGGRRYVAAASSQSPSLAVISVREANPNEVTTIHYSINGISQPVVDTSVSESVAFPLEGGVNKIEYFGMSGTQEEVRGVAVIYADDSAPQFGGLELTGPVYPLSSPQYINGALTTGALSFVEPLIETGTAGSGIAFMSYKFDSGEARNTTGPISFSGLGTGPVTITFTSQDNVGNVSEVAREFTVDGVSPTTVYSVEGTSYTRPADGKLFVTGLPPAIALTASDNKGGSELEGIYARLNGSAAGDDLVKTSSPASIQVAVPGENVLRYRSSDNLGNSEVLRVLALHYDDKAPVTSAVGKEPFFAPAEGPLYIGAPSLGSPGVYLSASDAAGAGIKETVYGLDVADVRSYILGSLISISAEGQHSIVFRSADNVGLQELENEKAIYLDLSAPALNIIPQSGSKAYMSGGVTYVAPGTVLDVKVSESLGSGAGWVSASLDGKAPQKSSVQGTAVATEHLLAVALPSSEGVHALTVAGADRVGNQAGGIAASFTVDATPPSTEIKPQGAFSDLGVIKYADKQTTFLLEAADKLGNGAPGSGIKEVSYRINGGPVLIAQAGVEVLGPFAVEGVYTIEYFTADNVGNTEAAKTFEVQVVAKVPSVSLIVTGPRADIGGKIYVRSPQAANSSEISLAASAGGAAYIWYKLDEEAPIVATGPAVVLGTLGAGSHSLRFKGVSDPEGADAEVEISLALVGDDSVPEIVLDITDAQVPAVVEAEGRLYIRPAAQLGLAASDPQEGSVPGSGVQTLTASVDGGTALPVSGSFSLSQEGAHELLAKAIDRLGLTGTAAYSLVVDGSAPSASILPSGALISIGGVTYGSRDISYSILAEDRPAGMAAGVGQILYGLEGAAPGIVYDPALPIKFTANGLHTIKYSAKDLLGHVSGAGAFQVNVDLQAPTNIALTTFGAVYVDPSGRRYGSFAASYGVTASDAGVGLSRLEIRRDDGTFETYAVPVSFAAPGAHMLGVKAFDRVGNASPVSEFGIFTDGAAPVSSIDLAAGTPGRWQGEVIWISSATKLEIRSSDPEAVAGIPGSGVKETRVMVPGQSERGYTAPFSVEGIADGLYAVSYYSRDNVLNAETRKYQSVYLDNTAPAAPAVEFDASSGSVVLTWSGASEPDLAGWRVYRTVNGDPATRRLLSGPDPIVETTLTDAEPAELSFTTLVYEITGVDLVGNAGEAAEAVVRPADLAPKMEVMVNGAEVEDEAFMSAVSLDLVARIRGASEPSIVVRLNGAVVGSAQAAEYSLKLVNEGTYTVTLSAVRDGETLEGSRTFTLDRTPPQIVALGNGQPLAAGALFNVPVVLAFTAVDENPDSVTGRLNGVEIPSGVAASQTGKYTLSVSAADRAGNEAAFDAGFEIDMVPPAAPQGLAGDMTGATSAKLQWNRNSELDLAGYRVYRDGVNITPELVTQPEADPVAFDDSGVPLGTPQALYEVRAVDLAGNESAGAQVTVIFDVTPPVTALAVGSPRFGEEPPTNDEPSEAYGGQQPMYVGTSAILSLSAADDLTGVVRTEYRFDSSHDFVEYAQELEASAAPSRNAPFAFEFRSTDNAANVEATRTATLYVDTAAPETVVELGYPRDETGPFPVISSKTPLEFTSVDAGSSVMRIEVFLDGEPLAELKAPAVARPFKASLTLPESVPDGKHMVSWQATDRVGNVELAGAHEVVLDNKPPSAGISMPKDGERIRLEQTIEGTAADEHFAYYRLEYAPAGSEDFVEIEPKGFFEEPPTVGTLAQWATLGLNGGEYVLRLTVTDVVGNAATARTSVFKGCKPFTFNPPGEPVPVLAFVRGIGTRGRAEGQMRLPIGVGAGEDGRIYVADTQNQRVQVFSKEGAFLDSFGRHGEGEGAFNQPEAAVVTLANGKLYVADRNNHRVQVFDTEGGLEFTFGEYGTGEGQFVQPAAIAVDKDGRAYVADALNHRIQVFNHKGEFLFMFGSHGNGEGEFNQPAGIALGDSCGVFVTDRLNNRVQAFDEAGNFLYVLDTGRSLKHPTGIALSPDEGHLYVADTGNNEVALFDRSGRELGRFGGFGAVGGKFDAPQGLAWDEAGQFLYVADTHNNRVQVFGWAGPAGTAAAKEAKRPDKLRLPKSALAAVAQQPAVAGSAPGASPAEGESVNITALLLSPNPFDPKNGETLTIAFGLNVRAGVSVVVYDKLMKPVKTFGESTYPAGMSQILWNGIADDGQYAQGALYTVRVTAVNGTYVSSRDAVLEVTNRGGNVPGGSE